MRDGKGLGTDARPKNVRKKSLFEEYAKTFRVLLASWTQDARSDKVNEDEDDLVLPSNEEWRFRAYYRLVESQREEGVNLGGERVDEEDGLETVAEWRPRVEGKKADWEWEPRGRLYSLRAKPRNHRNEESKEVSSTSVIGVGGSMTEAYIQPGWRANDILLAAGVLQRAPSPAYSDEAEMRRVFGLVYDVLRYKKVFSRALEDVGFWRRYGRIKDQEKIVWLLLYDMQGRKFLKPRSEIAAREEREKVFKAAGLKDVENSLLEVKTHLAASISRLRIRGSALNLDELLPTPLRVIEGVTWGEPSAIASGWINTGKVRGKEKFHEEMSRLNLTYCEGGEATGLDETEYAFDPICPKVVNLHGNARETLAISSLVREHRFVFLERSLCLGAAALAQAIRVGRIRGPIVLTHSLAPRHTGYLAGLLADIDHAGRLLAFGAGDLCSEYEAYLKNLGVTSQHCRVFPEKYAACPVNTELERATAVLAVPSCSYTGVRNIVDLAVARGGDIDLLESLTNAYDDGDEKYNDREQWRNFLTDQMTTLRYALTRPNVQFVVYEVHTISPSETTDMVRSVVDSVNRMAAERHREHPRKLPRESKPAKWEEVEDSREELAVSVSNVSVPDTDLFEVGSVDDVYGEDIGHTMDPGCFLTVIKRKEMTQFDSLFMIKVAESKGLFGNPKVEKPSKNESAVYERSAKKPVDVSARKCSKRVKIEVDRLMTHTYSSLSRSTQENQICPRHERCSSWGETAFQVYAKESRYGVRSPRRALRDQKESVNRLSTPVRGKSLRQKKLRTLRSMFASKSSRLDPPASRTTLEREETSSTLSSLLAVEPRPREDWGNGICSSTVLTSPILARALRPVPLENVDVSDHEEEKVQMRPRISRRNWTTRMSRLLHPAGSPSNVLDTILDIL